MTQPDLFDICANRHGGNEQSVKANRRVNKSGDTERIIEIFKENGGRLHLKKAARIMGKFPNAISGRFTSLLATEVIEKIPGETAEHCQIYKLKNYE